MASSNAVRPLDWVNVRRFWIFSRLVVKSSTSSGRSLNCTRKNSSSGLAVLKKCATASRDFVSLFPMLPLVSKTQPMESGASSLAKWVTFCSTLSSNSRKFSFSNPVTKRLSGSVTVTLIKTTVVSTRMSVFGPFASGAVGLARGSIVTLGLSALQATDPSNRDSRSGKWILVRDVIGLSHSSIRVYQDLDVIFQKAEIPNGILLFGEFRPPQAGSNDLSLVRQSRPPLDTTYGGIQHRLWYSPAFVVFVALPREM